MTRTSQAWSGWHKEADLTLADGFTCAGRRVRLRPVTRDDIPFLQTLWNNGLVMRHVGYPDGLGMTETKMEAWWQRCQGWTATHVIVEDLQGVSMGESGWGFQGEPGLLEIKLSPEFWGQGYAQEVLGLVIEHVLQRTAIPQVITTPHQDNESARSLYHRLGLGPAAAPPGICVEPPWECWVLKRPKPPPPPTTLIFDWGGVLMRTRDDSLRRAWEARLGLPHGGVERAVFESDVWREAQLGRCSVSAYWESIGKSLELTAELLTQFRHDFWAGDHLNQALIKVIEAWKEAGLRVVLLSNFSSELDSLLDELEVRRLFDPIIISAHEGIMKPASRLYWRVLNRIGILAVEALFVDDAAENIAGARSVGLHAVHFVSTEQAVADIERILS